MITIKRYSFKETIRYRGNSYKWNSSYNVLNKPLRSSNLLRVEVYNRRLEGKGIYMVICINLVYFIIIGFNLII